MRHHLLALASIALVATAGAFGTVATADKPKFVLDGQKLVVPGPVVFDTGKASIRSESDPTLEHVKAYLKATKRVTLLRIEVHADSMGSDEWNQRLTEARALAVAQDLVGRGVDCKRLIPVGFGSSKPIGDNKTPQGRAMNRRTEFVNAAVKKKPIGGNPVDGGGVVAGDPCAQP